MGSSSATTSDPTAMHTFATAGTYPVKLTASDGQSDASVSKDVVVKAINLRPTAAFEFTPVDPMEGEEVTVDASDSMDPENVAMTYTWDWDDGSAEETTPDLNRAHTYASAGSYTVRLTVSDGFLSDFVEHQVTVTEVDADPELLAPAAVDMGDVVKSQAILVRSQFDPSVLVRMVAQSKRVVEISNGGSGVLAVSSVSVDTTSDPSVSLRSSFLLADGGDVPRLAAGESHFLVERFVPVGRTGAFEGVLNVDSNAGNITIPISGSFLPNVSGGSAQLMQLSNARDDNVGALLDFGVANSSGRQALSEGIYSQGDAPVTITGVEILPGPDSAFFSAQLSAAEIALPSGQRLDEAGEEIRVTFTGTDRADPVRRRAKMVIRTASGPEPVVGLVGIDGNLALPEIEVPRTIEFERVPPRRSTDRIGSNVKQDGEEQFITPARITLRNVGSKNMTVATTLMPLTGETNSFDVVDELRVIAVASGYRLFMLADNSDFWSVDVDAAGNFGIPVALTDALSETLQPNFRMDGTGGVYTVTQVNSAETTRIQVFREDLFNSQGKELFAESPELPLDDGAEDVLVDKQGNVFVKTALGIYRFEADGTPFGYVLAGSTYYTGNLVGNEAGFKNAEWEIDFDNVWFDK